MEKAALSSYFDTMASEWDILHPCSPDKLRCLTTLCVEKGARVLEIGCGTGAILPYIMERQPSYLLAVDLSEKMLEIARQKCSDPRIEYFCGDIMEYDVTDPFDCAIIYEMFPFIENRGSMVRQMHHVLGPNGRIMICDGNSRQFINSIKPQGTPLLVPLPAAKTLASNYTQYFDMDTLVDSNDIYAISGKKIPL